MDTLISSINVRSQKDENFDQLLSEEREYRLFNSAKNQNEDSSSEMTDVSAVSKNICEFEYRYWYVIFFTINASLGNFFVGWNVGLLNPIQLHLASMFEKEEILLSIVPALIFGVMIGAIGSRYFTKKLGRRKAYMCTNVISWIGTGLTLILNEFTIIAGRFAIGLCIGLYFPILSVYVNEFVPYVITGLCGAIYVFVYSLGIFFGYVAGLNLPDVDEPPNQMWRVIILILALLNVVNMLFLLFVFSLETPKYLY